MRLPVACAVALVGVLFLDDTVARADLPPPDNEKFVDFTFTVNGLSKAPDLVVFGYPCGGSNGAPRAEHRILRDGQPNSVGRRGGQCALYAIPKSDYEAWAKTYVPSTSSQDPKLEELQRQAKACTGKPTMRFTLPKTDSRTKIEETLDVVTLDAKECVLTSRGVTTASAPSPASSVAPAPAPIAPTPAATKGCAIGSRGGSNHSAAYLLAVLVPGLLRRRNRAPSRT